MKTLVILGLLLGSVSMSHAACLADSGICWGGGKTTLTAITATLQSMTTTQIDAYAPSAVGELVYCNSCTVGFVCVSTGTGTGAFAVASSTATGPAGKLHCQ